MEYAFTAAQLESAMKDGGFYNNVEKSKIIHEATEAGMVRRLSHTQKEWTEYGVAWYQGEVAQDLGHVYKEDYYSVIVDFETKSFFMVKNAGCDAHIYSELKKSQGYYANRFKAFSNGTEKLPSLTKVPKKYHKYVCFDRRPNV